MLRRIFRVDTLSRRLRYRVSLSIHRYRPRETRQQHRPMLQFCKSSASESPYNILKTEYIVRSRVDLAHRVFGFPQVQRHTRTQRLTTCDQRETSRRLAPAFRIFDSLLSHRKIFRSNFLLGDAGNSNCDTPLYNRLDNLSNCTIQSHRDDASFLSCNFEVVENTTAKIQLGDPYWHGSLRRMFW